MNDQPPQPQQQTQPQSKEPELPNTTIWLMVSVALFFDVLQGFLLLIPIFGWILSPLVGFFAFLTFYLWFTLHGIKFSGPKRLGSFAGGIIVELIPFLNFLPAWTVAILIMALDTKIKKIVR